MPIFIVGGTVKGIYCTCRPAGFCVKVVAVVLGKGLLKNYTPNGAIRPRFGCVRGVCSVASFINGHVVVDNDRVRDTKGVEIHTVDAIGAQLVFSVQEDRIQAALLLSECRGSGQEPTVANLALSDVLRSDAIGTKQSLFWVSYRHSLPHGRSCIEATGIHKICISLTGILPYEGVPIVWESCISELSGPTVNAVEVGYSCFVPFLCACADCCAIFFTGLSLGEELSEGCWRLIIDKFVITDFTEFHASGNYCKACAE